MSAPIQNRYEFLYLFDCENGNPNGDPDNDNLPRVDPETMLGLVSDVAIKRRIRNYVQTARDNTSPYAIFVQHAANLNRPIASAHEAVNGPAVERKATKVEIEQARRWICDRFYDVRTFGAVMTTGRNAGQVRGPVQITFARSIDPVMPLDFSITRVASTDGKATDSSATLAAWEAAQPRERLHTFARKALLPYALFVGKGFVSAHLAQDTRFSEADLDLLWEAIVNMFEHDRSSTRGLMTLRKLIVFKHEGTDNGSPDARRREAMLGCAPAHALFDTVRVTRRNPSRAARAFEDYEVTFDRAGVPKGVSAMER